MKKRLNSLEQREAKRRAIEVLQDNGPLPGKDGATPGVMSMNAPYPNLQPIPNDVPNRRLGAIAGLADYQAQWHKRLPDIIGQPRALSLFDIVWLAGVAGLAVALLATLPGLIYKMASATILITVSWSLCLRCADYRKHKPRWEEAARIASDSEALARSIGEQSRGTPADDAEAAKRIEARFKRESEALRKRIHAIHARDPSWIQNRPSGGAA